MPSNKIKFRKANKKDTILTQKELTDNLKELREELFSGFKLGF